MKINRIDTEHFSARHDGRVYTIHGVTYGAKRLMQIRGMRGDKRRLLMGSTQLLDTMRRLDDAADVVQDLL